MKMKILLFFFTALSFTAFAQEPKVVGKLDITHLDGDYYIFTTYKLFNNNPFPSNGMYLATNDGVVMFDTPWDSTQMQPLLDSITARHHQKVTLCISTHFHVGNIADANLAEWGTTIKNVIKRCKKPKYIIPGHFGWGSKRALRHTLKLLKEH